MPSNGFQPIWCPGSSGVARSSIWFSPWFPVRSRGFVPFPPSTISHPSFRQASAWTRARTRTSAVVAWALHVGPHSHSVDDRTVSTVDDWKDAKGEDCNGSNSLVLHRTRLLEEEMRISDRRRTILRRSECVRGLERIFSSPARQIPSIHILHWSSINYCQCKPTFWDTRSVKPFFT